MKRISFLIVGLVACSFIITLCSVYLQRTDHVDDPKCTPSGSTACESVHQVSGGFPVTYLFDNLSVSVRGHLSFSEDELSLPRFLADWIIHTIAIAGLIALGGRLRDMLVVEP